MQTADYRKLAVNRLSLVNNPDVVRLALDDIQLLDEVLVISRIIKVEVRAKGLRSR